jgi:hypothetical protein
MADLLPCPFCETRAYLMPQGLVECGGCGAVVEGLDAEDAATTWNTRTPTEHPRDRGRPITAPRTDHADRS